MYTVNQPALALELAAALALALAVALALPLPLPLSTPRLQPWVSLRHNETTGFSPWGMPSQNQPKSQNNDVQQTTLPTLFTAK